MSPLVILMDARGTFSPLLILATILGVLILANAIRRLFKGATVRLLEWLAPALCTVSAGLATSLWRLATIPQELVESSVTDRCNPLGSLSLFLSTVEAPIAMGALFGAIAMLPALFFAASPGADARETAPRRVWWLRGAAVLGALTLFIWLSAALPALAFAGSALGELTSALPWASPVAWGKMPAARMQILLYVGLTLLVGLPWLARADLKRHALERCKSPRSV